MWCLIYNILQHCLYLLDKDTVNKALAVCTSTNLFVYVSYK